MEMIRTGQKSGHKRIEFTGGEPTIRPDIFELIAAAKKSGFEEIAISTNGRMLGYERFLDKAIDAGLNRITLTLYGSKPEIHNAVSRTQDSFDQTVSGIKNILAKEKIALSVNTVVCRLNCQDLLETGKFISKLGAKVWGVLDLIPFGNAERFYDTLAVDIETLSSSVRRLREIAEDFDQIEFFDFPVCVLGKELTANQRITVFDAQGRMDEFKQVGYNPRRFESKNDFCEDVHKSRISVCKNCAMNRRCAGIWKPYPNIFGKSPVEKAVKNCAVDFLNPEK
jgi:MoaA/NifB/PqqE/SkfB family radical SAM enzyme